MPRALRVRDEIQTLYSKARVSLAPKTGGYFDVSVDGKIIFSKTEKIGTTVERFPEIGEITTLLKEAGYTQA